MTPSMVHVPSGFKRSVMENLSVKKGLLKPVVRPRLIQKSPPKK